MERGGAEDTSVTTLTLAVVAVGRRGRRLGRIRILRILRVRVRLLRARLLILRIRLFILRVRLLRVRVRVRVRLTARARGHARGQLEAAHVFTVAVVVVVVGRGGAGDTSVTTLRLAVVAGDRRGGRLGGVRSLVVEHLGASLSTLVVADVGGCGLGRRAARNLTRAVVDGVVGRGPASVTTLAVGPRARDERGVCDVPSVRTLAVVDIVG